MENLFQQIVLAIVGTFLAFSLFLGKWKWNRVAAEESVKLQEIKSINEELQALRLDLKDRVSFPDYTGFELARKGECKKQHTHCVETYTLRLENFTQSVGSVLNEIQKTQTKASEREKTFEEFVSFFKLTTETTLGNIHSLYQEFRLIPEQVETQNARIEQIRKKVDSKE